MATDQTDVKLSASHLEVISHDGIAKREDTAADRGAILLEQERHLPISATLKEHRRELLVSCTAIAAALMFGFDTIVNGASISMPAFLLYFGEMGPTGPYLPSIWTSLWTSMSALCQALGALSAGVLTDRLGRKWPASSAGIISIAGAAMQYCATTRELLMGGKMVTGFGVGLAYTIGASYASEIAPLKLRGLVQSGLILFTVLMQALALGVIRILVPNVHEEAFRRVFATQWAVGGIVVIAFALAPESPVYLVANGKIEQAKTSLARIYGSDNAIDDRLAYLVRTIRDEESHQELHRGTYLECFSRKNIKRTLTVMLLYSSANIGGAAFLAQSIYFLIIAGLAPIHAFDVSIGGFGLAVVLIMLSWLVQPRINRRLTFLSGCVVNFAIMLIIGCLYYSKSSGALWAIAVLMNILISLQNSLLQAMGWPIAAELSSLRLRAKTLAVAMVSQTLTNWLTTFTVPYMYNVDSGNLGARTGFVFMGLTVLLTIGAYFLVPETKGLTTPEVDRLYEAKVAPRRFAAEGRELESDV